MLRVIDDVLFRIESPSRMSVANLDRGECDIFFDGTEWIVQVRDVDGVYSKDFFLTRDAAIKTITSAHKCIVSNQPVKSMFGYLHKDLLKSTDKHPQEYDIWSQLHSEDNLA